MYYARVENYHLDFKKNGKENALKALQERVRENIADYEDYKHILYAKKLEDAFYECNFILGDDCLYLDDPDHFREYDANFLLTTISPYLKEGSYIEMPGEDNSQWKYVFDGKTMEEKEGTVVYN